MTRLELALSPDALRKVLAEEGCLVGSESTLRTHPGSIHWHIRRPGQHGTLEATWLSNGEQWIGYHANRYAPWMDAVLKELMQ